MVSSKSEGQLWIVVCLFVHVWMFQVAAWNCLTLSPVFLVYSKSGGPSQGGLIIAQGPIMTMTCNLSLSTERPAGHKQTAEIRLTLAKIPSLKRGLIKTCEKGQWRGAVCAGTMTESKLWPNCGSQLDFIIELSSTCQHICTCTLSGVCRIFFCLDFFGRQWWHWAA